MSAKIGPSFNFSGNIKMVNVEKTGVFKLECWGAAGGGTNKPRGAYSVSFVSLSKGDNIFILVGEAAGTGDTSDSDIRCGGGGGGTFIAKGQSISSSIPLCVAGGGGSQNYNDVVSDYSHGQSTRTGGDKLKRSQNIGYGGNSGTGSSGGGFYGDGILGSQSDWGNPGVSFLHGGTKVLSPRHEIRPYSYGGFGGGSSIHGNCGGPAGGGGYTGGSVSSSEYDNGGGGGSFHIGSFGTFSSYSKSGFENMPNPKSPSGEEMKGNNDNGFARITNLQPSTINSCFTCIRKYSFLIRILDHFFFFLFLFVSSK